MRFKVEMLYIDQTDESDNVSHTLFCEADNTTTAVEMVKQRLTVERPDLNPHDRWFWFAYPTAEANIQGGNLAS